MKLWTSHVILIMQQTVVSFPTRQRQLAWWFCCIHSFIQKLANLVFLWAYTAFCLCVSGYPYHITFNSLSPPYPLDCGYCKGKGWTWSSLMVCERVMSLASWSLSLWLERISWDCWSARLSWWMGFQSLGPFAFSKYLKPGQEAILQVMDISDICIWSLLGKFSLT